MKLSRLFSSAAVALVLSLVLLGAGCTSVQVVQVSGLADAAALPTERTFHLVPGGAGLVAASLEYRQVATQVRRTLTQLGYRETTAGEAALTLALSYGVGEPLTRTNTFSAPLYAEVGGGVNTTTSQTTNAAGETKTATTTTVQPGRYERVGSDVSVSTIITYRKHLTLTARPAREAAEAPEVWSATAVRDDESPDLRASIPMLLAALAPHLGTDTGRAIPVELVERADGTWQTKS